MAELLGTEELPQQGQSNPVQELGLPWVPLGLWEELLRSNHKTSNLSAPCPSPALPELAYVSIKVQSQALSDMHSSHWRGCENKQSTRDSNHITSCSPEKC